MEITIDPEELANGEMSPTHLDRAVHAIRTDGYVILSDIISHAHLDLVREKMDEDLRTLMTASVLPVNFVKQHLSKTHRPLLLIFFVILLPIRG